MAEITYFQNKKKFNRHLTAYKLKQFLRLYYQYIHKVMRSSLQVQNVLSALSEYLATGKCSTKTQDSRR